MAKKRYVNTKFWDDNYIVDLDPTEKLLFIYILTNPLTNISGIYEIPIRRIAFDTGLNQDMVVKILNRFEDAKKIRYENGWICVKNFIKHQAMNPKIERGIDIGMMEAPENMKNWLFDKPMDSLSKPLNYSNSNLNSNSNYNKEPIFELLEVWNTFDIRKHRKDVVDKYIKRKHLDMVELYTSDTVKSAIELYAKVVSDDNYYFNHIWSLWDFIGRDNALPNFIPDAKPLENYKVSDKSEPSHTKILDEMEAKGEL